VYFGLIIGNIVGGSRLIERVIVIGGNTRHFRYLATRNPVEILGGGQGGC